MADRVSAGKAHVGHCPRNQARRLSCLGLDLAAGWELGVAVGRLAQGVVVRIVLRLIVKVDRHARAFPQSGRRTDGAIMTSGD
jgi:hypothetical protein